jgi:predicted alpha/beta superfamily hydrolase
MRQRGLLLGLLALLGLYGPACGDDSPATPEDGSGSSTGSPGTDTIPLPTGTATTSEPGTSTVDPDTTAGDTGILSDVGEPAPDDCERLDELVAALPGAAPDDRQPLVDDFVRTVTYGDHGFPIVCDGSLAVVHLASPGESLSLAGDFNDWVPGEHPLQEPVPDLGFYVAVIDVAAPAGLYKLVRDETEFFADPLARRFGWDQFGEYSQIDPMPDRGHHERWPAFDESVGALQPRTVTAWLPVGAFDEADPLPVLYMHDGQNLFSPDAFFGGWRVSETLEAAIADGTLPPLVVVGIDNTSARFEEYTPVTDVLDGMRVGGRADEYADFLVQGVKPFAEARYPVSQEPSRVGTMGSSLGGLISLYLGLRHPDVFGQVASMSGTIAWGTFGASNPTIIELYQGDAPLGLRLYVDSGGGQGTGCPDGGSDNYCGNVAFASELRAMGWQDEVDLFYRWDPGAPHNEAAWGNRLLPALVDWFPAGG